MGSWLAVAEMNLRLREESESLIEFCRARATDPRRLTHDQRVRMIRQAERLEDAVAKLTGQVTGIVTSPEVFGDGPNPRTREGQVLGLSLQAPWNSGEKMEDTLAGPAVSAKWSTEANPPSPARDEDIRRPF